MATSALTEQNIEEMLSHRYVQAVAERAGFITAPGGYPDNDGVDLQIRAGGARRPRLEVQLKATINLRRLRNGLFAYPLQVKNYAQLITEGQTPFILVVLDLPQNREAWLEVSDDSLILRHLAYWIDLSGQPDTDRTNTITIHLDPEQRFTVAAIRELMDRAESRSS